MNNNTFITNITKHFDLQLLCVNIKININKNCIHRIAFNKTHTYFMKRIKIKLHIRSKDLL